MKIVLYLSICALQCVYACSPYIQRSSSDANNCFEIIPRHVKGLTVVSGPRSKQSIILDMVPVICNGHTLFEYMKSKGKKLTAGSVTFKVTVEYTGEVLSATIEDTTIQSEEFLCKVSNFIMDMDFVVWARDDKDTVFFYPANFGRYK